MNKNITQGKWELHGLTIETHYAPDGHVIALMNDIGDRVATDGSLIVTAVNSCKAVNPEYPMAVAENIEKAFSTLRMVQQELCFGGDWETAKLKIGGVLSAIERKEK